MTVTTPSDVPRPPFRGRGPLSGGAGRAIPPLCGQAVVEAGESRDSRLDRELEEAFAQGVPYADDRTMVILRKLG
jgi:hypothetical protein